MGVDEAAPGDRFAVDADGGDIRHLLEERIVAFNLAATGIADAGGVAFSVRDERGALVAGLSGWTWGGCLFVEFLWVSEDRRGQGLGARLLAAAEDEARARGCGLAALDTHDFQAPGSTGGKATRSTGR